MKRFYWAAAFTTTLVLATSCAYKFPYRITRTDRHPERGLMVSDIQTNPPHLVNNLKDYKTSSYSSFYELNSLYAPEPFESVAYFNDYNLAGMTQFDPYLRVLTSNSVSIFGTNVLTVTNRLFLTNSTSGIITTNVATSTVTNLDLRTNFVSQLFYRTNVEFGGITADLINDQRKIQRNAFLFKYMQVISQHYGSYIEDVTGGKATFDIVSDTVMLGGNAVAVLTPAASTKAAWNAALIAFGGSKLSVDKNIFLNQSIMLLAAKMEDNRVKERGYIRDKMKQSIDAYPLSEAALDLQELYEAGTLMKVLEDTAKSQTSNTNTILVLLGSNNVPNVNLYMGPQQSTPPK